MTKKITVNAPSKKITVNSTTKVVTVVTPGAQGAIAADFELEDTNKVDGSILRYSTSIGKYVADSTITPLTLTDGGNF